MKIIIITVIAVCGFAVGAKSQIYVRSNLLWDAMLMPNIGVEFSVSDKITLGADFYASWLGAKKHKTQGWMPSIEGRYYFSELFKGHHLGITASYYNINKVKYFYSDSYAKDGYAVGGGLLYGYSINLGEKWNLSFNIGAEYTSIKAYKMQKRGDGTYRQPANKEKKSEFMPRAGIVLAWKINTAKCATCPRYDSRYY